MSEKREYNTFYDLPPEERRSFEKALKGEYKADSKPRFGMPMKISAAALALVITAGIFFALDRKTEPKDSAGSEASAVGTNYFTDTGNTGNAEEEETELKFSTVSLRDDHSTALMTDGCLYTWGYNEDGQLGDGTTEDKSTPTKIMDNVESVSLGFYHSAAITKDGSLYTWGSNYSGQLGDGTTTDRSTPTLIKITE